MTAKLEPGCLAVVVGIPENMQGYEQNGMICVVYSIFYEESLGKMAAYTSLPRVPSHGLGLYAGGILTKYLIPLDPFIESEDLVTDTECTTT